MLMAWMRDRAFLLICPFGTTEWVRGCSALAKRSRMRECVRWTKAMECGIWLDLEASLPTRLDDGLGCSPRPRGRQRKRDGAWCGPVISYLDRRVSCTLLSILCQEHILLSHKVHSIQPHQGRYPSTYLFTLFWRLNVRLGWRV